MRCPRPRRHEGVRWRFRSTLRVADTAFTGEKEVPLDALASRRNGAPRPGQKREKMGGGDGVTGNGAPFPAAHLFPSPHPARRQEAGEIPNDDHAVLSVVEAVHFHPYLLGEGLHLLAVDVDGYPAGAALCHDVKFWQRWPKRPSQDGTVNMIIKLKLVGELNFISELLTVHT